MNIIKDNVDKRKKDFTQKSMTIKPTVIGNTLMPPPSNKFLTPSCRIRNKDQCPSSTSHSKSTPTIHRDSHVVVSICEGRGKATGLVGIAAIDLHRPVLILSEISDTHTYTSTLTKLNILRPSEVLVPASFIENVTPIRLITVILNQFPNMTVNSVPRSEFNKSRGLQIIQTICVPAFSDVIPQITEKFYALSASCALLRYVEQCRNILYSQKTVKVEFQEPENMTAIDIDTAELLELTTYTGNQKNSLFTVLNYCSTVVGKKLLRTNILQPPRRKNLIEARLDCVQELSENPNLLTGLQENLKSLADIHASLTFATVVPATAASVSERQLNYTLQLKGLLTAIQPLANELKGTKHPIYSDIYNRIQGLDTRQIILDKINNILNEDAHLAKGQAGEMQRCFAIKSGINGFLDLSRRLYTEGVDSMRSYVDNLTTEYNLPLRVQHTIKNGFHIILPLNKALRNLKKTDLPAIFINVERYRSHFYLTTMEMINFDRRLKNNSIEIQNISNVIIYELLVSIRPYIGDLFNLCDDVAQLDMLVSLARASSQSNWVRPKLVDTHMYLEGARHPILEKIGDQELIANSLYAYPRCNVHILTGPNMSGKTICLHTICLLQVLCQIGCFVPCTSATFRISQRISARVAEDDTSLQQSSFALEMTKLSYLLNTLTDTSLIVLDELCKTTACDEGVSIAMAIIEKLATRGCFVFIASHFLTLTIMENMYPNIKNWHLETLEEYRANNTRISLKFTYKLTPGPTKMDSYGIKLSRIFNSSKSISDRAMVLYNYLLPLRKSVASESRLKNPDYLKFKFQAELDLMKIKNQLTDVIQKDKIDEFKVKTGLSFEPSPITIERTSTNSFSHPSSTKSSSEVVKRVSDSCSSMPCLSSKTASSSNHEFSVPTSLKTELSDKSKNNHIFSFDGMEIQEHSAFLDTCTRNSKTNSENCNSGKHTEGTNSRFMRPIGSVTSDDNKFLLDGSNLQDNSSFLYCCAGNLNTTKYSEKSKTGFERPSYSKIKISDNNNFLFFDSKIQESSFSGSYSRSSEKINNTKCSAETSIKLERTINTESKASNDNTFLLDSSNLQENSSLGSRSKNSKSNSDNFNNSKFSEEISSGFGRPINKESKILYDSSSFISCGENSKSKSNNSNQITISETIQPEIDPPDNFQNTTRILPTYLLDESDIQQNSSFVDSPTNKSKLDLCNSENKTFLEKSNSEFVPRAKFLNKSILFLSKTNKSEGEKSEHWSLAENTINNNNASCANMIVNSTVSDLTGKYKSPFREKSESFSIFSKLPISTSQHDLSSPILNKRSRRSPPKSEKKTKEIRLVSELYDSGSSDEDCHIINYNYSITEESFQKDLNLKHGATSTPKIFKNRNNESVFNRSIESSKYYSCMLESPILKRKLSPIVEMNENIKSVNESSTNYESCSNSSISKCSTNVVIGQNYKIHPFSKLESNAIKDEVETNNSKYYSTNLNSSSDFV